MKDAVLLVAGDRVTWSEGIEQPRLGRPPSAASRRITALLLGELRSSDHRLTGWVLRVVEAEGIAAPEVGEVIQRRCKTVRQGLEHRVPWDDETARGQEVIARQRAAGIRRALQSRRRIEAASAADNVDAPTPRLPRSLDP